MYYFITNTPSQDLFGFEMLTIGECADMVSKEKEIAIDVETDGLSHLDNTLLMVQISTKSDDFIIDARSVDITPLQAALKEVVCLGHNIVFDYKFLRANGVQLEKVYDTMLVSKVLNTGKDGMSHALKDVLKRLLKIELDKDVRDTFGSNFIDGALFTKAQVVYGAEDTRHLLKVKELQLPIVKKWELENVVKLENAVTLAFGDISYNGMFLDKEQWEDKAELAKIAIDELLPQMDRALLRVTDRYVNKQIDMFGDNRACTINWNSPLQVLEVFRLLHPELPSVGADIIKHYRDPIIKNYKIYKEKTKLYNAYGIAYYKYLHSDGKVHTKFNQVLNTGRVSSSSPNMQQVLGDYRECFIPEKEDWVYVSADYSSQELAVIAHGAKEEVWLKAIRNGDDLHSICAELVFKDKWRATLPGSPERKHLRQSVKAISFGLAYGMGPFGLSNRLEITETEAKDLIKEYFGAFPRIKAFLDSLGNFGKNTGLIRTYKPFRRVRWFPLWKGQQTENMGKIKRASNNTPIQGSASDMTKAALIFLRTRIAKLPYEVEIVAQIHDEIACVCHKNNAEVFSHVLQKAMEDAANLILEPGLLKAEPSISKTWIK